MTKLGVFIGGVLFGGALALFAGWMVEKTDRYGRRYR